MLITACNADFEMDDASDIQHTASGLTLSLWEWNVYDHVMYKYMINTIIRRGCIYQACMHHTELGLK